MTTSEPGGARVPADPPRPGLRARLSSLQGHDTLCLPVGEIRDLVAALDAARADVERLRAECNATADTVLELAAQRAAALSDCRDLQREVELLRGQVGAWDSAQAVWDAIGRIRKSLGGDSDV